MKEIPFESLPWPIMKTFLDTQFKLMLEMFEKAGLLEEFHNFIDSKEFDNMQSFENLCIEFAKQHPEKFYARSDQERYNHVAYISL